MNSLRQESEPAWTPNWLPRMQSQSRARLLLICNGKCLENLQLSLLEQPSSRRHPQFRWYGALQDWVKYTDWEWLRYRWGKVIPTQRSKLEAVRLHSLTQPYRNTMLSCCSHLAKSLTKGPLAQETMYTCATAQQWHHPLHCEEVTFLCSCAEWRSQVHDFTFIPIWLESWWNTKIQ